MSGPHTVLVVEDSDATRVFLEKALASKGYEVVSAATLPEARELIETVAVDLAFFDLKLGTEEKGGQLLLEHLHKISPDVPGIIVTADDRAQSAVELLRHGAYDYVVKPVRPEDVERLAARGVELRETRRTLALIARDKRSAGQTWDVGSTPRMKATEELVNKCALSSVGVLLQGESGTGKEVVARALHDRSERASGPFVAINCAAMPEELLENELFGHEKGAFTDAKEVSKGLLEIAHGGSLFLDEVAMMSPKMQAKLLRALQEFRFRRVGGGKEVAIDVRVISASNQDVLEAIAQGDFREDLYYRLAVVTIELPPLRERKVDIPFFAQKFLTGIREETGATVTGFSQSALDALTGYSWPGNIRELKNVVERAVILYGREPEIHAVHLPDSVRLAALHGGHLNGHGTGMPSALPAALPEEGLDLKALETTWERELLVQALARTDGNQTRAAELLGLTRDELRYRVEKFELPR